VRVLNLQYQPQCCVAVDVSALRIHISENAYDALKAFPDFVTVPRGEIFVKVRPTTLISVK